MTIHYYQQFFTGPNAPGTLTPRKLMRHLAILGNQVHVVATNSIGTVSLVAPFVARR